MFWKRKQEVVEEPKPAREPRVYKIPATKELIILIDKVIAEKTYMNRFNLWSYIKAKTEVPVEDGDWSVSMPDPFNIVVREKME